MLSSTFTIGGSCCLVSILSRQVTCSGELVVADFQPRSFHVDVASLNLPTDIKETLYLNHLVSLISQVQTDCKSDAAHTKDGANRAPNRIASLSALEPFVLDNVHPRHSKLPMEGQSITYTYSSLDESKRQIRLLHLLPAAEGGNSARNGQGNFTGTVTNHEAEIRCTFSVVSLDDHVGYEALSYVWGDTDNMQNICLYGHPFKVTKNLHAALLHMRTAGERILWADALCINQADINERGSQVLQMGSVFAQAHTVVVYLGEWTNSAIAFRLIEDLGYDPDRPYDNAASTQEAMYSCGVKLSPQMASAYLCEFFSLPWWSRLWTVQEYTLAQSVVFQSGLDVLHGKSLEDMGRSLVIHGSCCVHVNLSNGSWLKLWDPELMSHLNDCQIITRVRDTLSMARKCDLRMILRLCARRCSNPLDKIYGMLALTPRRFRRAVKPNYNLVHSELYTDATVAWIQLSRNLYILSSVDRTTFPSPDLPSYVPDFKF